MWNPLTAAADPAAGVSKCGDGIWISERKQELEQNYSDEQSTGADVSWLMFTEDVRPAIGPYE